MMTSLDATPPNPTGPAYRPRAPFRRRLAPAGDRGRPMVVSGRVIDTGGLAVTDVVLDFWHASSRGVYDLFSRQMRYRGRQRVDPDGRYRVETIEPGGYLWRPPHVHVKVHRAGQLVLTTQLYLPGHRRLEIDPAVRSLLLTHPIERDGSLLVAYDLVLEHRAA